MTNSHNFKTSFPPIADADTEILILGTLPGDRSLEAGEYFAHPRNRFWKIIACLTNTLVPEVYSDKKALLLKSGIGVWNVLHKAKRKGSLDNSIQEEVPNDLPAFLAQHEQVRVIAFDGLKAAALYNKHFSKKSAITYITLPGCSPANARYNLKALCDSWSKLLYTY